MHQSLMSRKVTLEPCTLVAMFEAYAYFVVLGKMEETADDLRYGICLDESLIKMLANVHIDNLMFSKLMIWVVTFVGTI
ncbi:BnaC02g13780D [Brassica napus]|uniref:(rape) hypothetical protein n=1 Tax=Brassica napus TaxID=3708 RepID=A0A078HYG4_BRANA|nr:unnamed protein product [Brassica napus]CDY41778.1 BnaC02g13780D [Brassica napus]